MNNVKLFTTPVVEGMPIEKYYGLVNANQVTGTGFFTDLTASFSDFFGGNSGAYRGAMNELCNDVTERIKTKAADMGANAIVGVKIDYDSISAKSMSMFMVSIQGTAVKLSMPKEEINDTVDSSDVTWEVLHLEYNKRRILNKLENKTPLKSEDWEFILKNPMSELMEPLYDYYVICKELNDNKQENGLGAPSVGYQEHIWATSSIGNYKKYLFSLNYKDAIQYVYKDINSFREIIEKNKLFNANKILELAKAGNLDDAVSALPIMKSSYNSEDCKEMLALKEYLNNLPEVGKMEEVKGGIFSSGGLKYVCTCGCKNDSTETYCSQCGKNIHGLTKQQQQEVNNFSELVDVLKDMLK